MGSPNQFNARAVDIFTPTIGLLPVEVAGGSRAVSFHHALETGKFPVGGKWDFYVDYNANDDFTALLEQMRERAMEEVARSPELQALLKKEYWTLDDRRDWQRGIAVIAAEETKVLGPYRTENKKEQEDGHLAAQVRSPRLNDLAVDVKNGTHHYEYDCEYMSAVRGLLIQYVEDHSLPLATADTGDQYKQAFPYFFMRGVVGVIGANDYGGHAYIASSATADVIEATNNNPDGLYKTSLPASRFADLVNGRVLSVMGNDGKSTVYASEKIHLYNPSIADVEWRLRQAEESVDKIVSILDDVKNDPVLKRLKAMLDGLGGEDVTFDDISKVMKQVEEQLKAGGYEEKEELFKREVLTSSRWILDVVQSVNANIDSGAISDQEKLKYAQRVSRVVSRFIGTFDDIPQAVVGPDFRDETRETDSKLARVIDEYNERNNTGEQVSNDGESHTPQSAPSVKAVVDTPVTP